MINTIAMMNNVCLKYGLEAKQTIKFCGMIEAHKPTSIIIRKYNKLMKAAVH